MCRRWISAPVRPHRWGATTALTSSGRHASAVYGATDESVLTTPRLRRCRTGRGRPTGRSIQRYCSPVMLYVYTYDLSTAVTRDDINRITLVRVWSGRGVVLIKSKTLQLYFYSNLLSAGEARLLLARCADTGRTHTRTVVAMANRGMRVRRVSRTSFVSLSLVYGEIGRAARELQCPWGSAAPPAAK